MAKEIITSQDRLLRRVIFMNPSFVKPDGTPTSGCFSLKKGEDGLSVDLERLTSFVLAIRNESIYRLFVLEVSEIEQHGLSAEHDPIEGNYAHSLIKGEITKSIARLLATKARRINYP